ncbi:zinc finger CCCH domain-containing protein 8 isoform X1 [Elaeis guineensis]|uniref:Zinc finger CCCH domain-containing protein 8 isoform X2 n=1 Tax=Elaeis guineensis var. tenera TaxID=51953 RepID=A0A6I9QQW7_ELAGV|nr:zinc finger CCCH domain-containing protein 8 isoform X2 [Elaeis guineensis]
MSNQIYNYSSSYGGGGGTSSFYSLRATNPYLSDGGSSRLSSVDSLAAADTGMYSDRMSSLYSKSGDGSLRLSGSDIAGYGAAGSLSAAGKIGGGIGTAPASRALFASSSLDPMVVGGAKRSVEALYNQSILGSHNTIGQSDAPFSSNSLVKRSRLETASNLPIYPQRPGEKDCAHYMLTRTCTFGNSCKFDHPIWVPEGGIPDWKEIPLVPASESLPEKPGEPDCPYYMKTQKCKFGSRCKFNHPKDKLNASADEVGGEGTENSVLPERPSEPLCSFYAKTGKCKFGPNCKFHHPKDLKIPPDGEDTDKMGEMESEKNDGSAGGDPKLAKAHVSITPALLHNSKGLPIRPGEADCPFYLKTGSCKYGATCRYNHPDRNSFNPPLASALGQAIMPSPATNLPFGVLDPAASFLQNINLQSAQASLGVIPTVYPQRPGEIECDYYMKTGLCKFGERCKFHHPIDRSAPMSDAKQAPQQNVKLTLAGLPRREGAVICSFYLKTGTCKFGTTCKFDHPPPGEAIAMATSQGTGSGTGTGVFSTESGEN